MRGLSSAGCGGFARRTCLFFSSRTSTPPQSPRPVPSRRRPLVCTQATPPRSQAQATHVPRRLLRHAHMSSARAPSASSSTALFPSASPSHQPEEGDAAWQKASILSGVLGAFRMVRKEAESHNGLAAPQARKLPAPMTRDQSILRIQSYVRGRKTRARARATLKLAKERAVTGGAARASPPSEELHGPVNEIQAAVGSAKGLAVVVTIDDAPPDEVSLAENTRVPQARAPRLAPALPRIPTPRNWLSPRMASTRRAALPSISISSAAACACSPCACRRCSPCPGE